tara:strand:+ start:296 stop:514 length:219 start_codon:yes stop_codon:yes gene_type:complete
MPNNLESVRETHNFKGPNVDNSSRIARIRKIQIRSGQASGANNGHGAAKMHGGDSSKRTMYSNAFVLYQRKP